MRLLKYAIAALLWLILGYFIKPCWDSNHCGRDDGNATDATSEVDTKSSITPAVTGPLLFNWNKGEPVLGDGWEARRQAILDGLGDNENLEITGLYRAEETNNSTFDNLGLSRASEIAKLFKPPLTDDRIQLNGRLVNAMDSDKTSLFKSAAFKNMINTEAIKEIADKTMIYFPFNSTDKLKSTEVEAYLNDVADRVKKSGEKVKLTGHTDNVDNDRFNYNLGMRRANIVKQYLLGKGVAQNQIIAESKGEKAPIATNDSSQGRAKNRRTELQIIK